MLLCLSLGVDNLGFNDLGFELGVAIADPPNHIDLDLNFAIAKDLDGFDTFQTGLYWLASAIRLSVFRIA